MDRRTFLKGALFSCLPLRGNKLQTFVSGSVVNQNLWCVIFPTGSSGLLQNVDSYLINRLNTLGIFVAGAWYPGCDNGEEDYGARYFSIGGWIQSIMSQYGLASPPILYCQSRGGLQGLSFACEAPSLVNRVACLYPCTNPDVYPQRGAALSNAHNKSDAEFDAIMGSSSKVISRYTPNAKAAGLNGKSVCIWHGDSDLVVPKTTTTDIFAPQCHAWVKTLTGFGHQAATQSLLDEIAHYIQWGVIPSGAVQQ